MKIAFPIALIVFGVVFITMLMTPRHWKVRTGADWQADHDKIEQAKQKWLDKNPEMKAEESEVNTKYEQADKAFRDARQTRNELNAALVHHDLKVRDELIKSDPTLEPAYDRVAFDKRVSLSEGDQELLVEYEPSFRQTGLFWTVSYVFPVVTLCLGIFLLVRPPSWASAHLLLVAIILPLTFLGPILLRFAISVYLLRYDELDAVPTPYMFQEAHRTLVRDFLFYVPPLLLYVILLIRIHFRERDAKRTDEGIR